MSILKIWLILSFSFLWTEVSWSKEVKYKDLPSLIKTNKKSKSLDFLIDSEKERISFLTRSFVPEVKLFAGQEEFHSNRLGDHSSSYHGVEARANVFNGMSDYWEEEKRKSELELSKAQKKISYGEMVYEARRSYLNLAEAQKIKAELNDSLSRLSGVFKKVQLKVKGGVISQSDLISLRLVQVELEHKIKDLDGVISIELARLKSFLSLSDLNINDIDQEVLGLTPDQKQPIGKPLLEEKFKAESGIFASESHALSGKKLPSVDLVANYGRLAFSQREFTENSDREEWSAGVQLTWKIGNTWENGRQSQSSRLNSQASEALGEHYSYEVKNHVEALTQKCQLLRASILDLDKEISLNKNYYTQISSEYLRGVKSTSDLTSAFGQLLEIKRHRLELLLQYHLAQAEIEKHLGEF